jgi:hypothetical protein
LLRPGHLLGEGDVTGGQLLETAVAFDAGDNADSFLCGHALAFGSAVFAALEQVVGALRNRLAVAADLVGLLAKMATDHLVDLAHFVKEALAFLLQVESQHSLMLYMLYTIFWRKKRKTPEKSYFPFQPPKSSPHTLE